MVNLRRFVCFVFNLFLPFSFGFCGNSCHKNMKFGKRPRESVTMSYGSAETLGKVVEHNEKENKGKSANMGDLYSTAMYSHHTTNK